MVLRFIKPHDPVLVEAPPAGGNWLHEVKYDGFRMQLVRDAGRIRAFSKTGRDWTAELTPVVNAAAALPYKSFILDGELVAVDEQGMPRFDLVRSSMRRWPERLIWYGFDLLHLEGKDYRSEHLEERRGALEAALKGAPPAIQVSEAFDGDGAEFFAAVERMGLEGIVSKRLGSRYKGGKSPDWLKTKCFVESELEVIGVERSLSGEPLALLAAREGKDRRFVGQATVGLREPARGAFWDYVRGNETPRAALQLGRKRATWLKPGLRAKVKHLRGEKMLRHAALTSVSFAREDA
jgi:bifunctional non-homologous end joining protein LigD